MPETSLPLRPSDREERLALRLFLALSPRLQRIAQPEPPSGLTPFEDVAIPRRQGTGVLTATWYPAAPAVPARGAVLLLHPWVALGRSYFHRRGRIQALRAAGYHALAVDLPGFGGSGAPAGFFDRDVEDALRFLRGRCGALPLHLWGVSSGGSWAHPVLSRTREITGAVFEDMSPHLLEWSWREEPRGRPGYLLFRSVFRTAYRFLDARRHAPALSVAAVAYISGGRDPGIFPDETSELARLTGGTSFIVPGAGHLASIQAANAEIVALALDTFRRAEELSTSRSTPCGTPSSPGGH